MEKIIEITNLKKSYGKVEAVKNIDFYVETGKLFAFLGPNGAGKSTTIDIISTLLKPDSGIVKIGENILGKDDFKIKSMIGIVFQDSLLDPLLTVKENLYIRGKFYNLSKTELNDAIERASDSTGVTDFLNRRYGKLSGGQRRRADIARALINTPKILFLDEPTTGLDPQTRKNVWETIQKLQKESGMTIFLTTHYMEEAANADYVVVIDNGTIAAQGTPEELKEKYSSDVLKIHSTNSEEIIKILNEQNVKYTVNNRVITIKLETTLEAIPIIDTCKDFIEGFEVQRGTMDDAFIGITGKEIRE